jgi:hypothetical protein
MIHNNLIVLHRQRGVLLVVQFVDYLYDHGLLQSCLDVVGNPRFKEKQPSCWDCLYCCLTYASRLGHISRDRAYGITTIHDIRPCPFIEFIHSSRISRRPDTIFIRANLRGSLSYQSRDGKSRTNGVPH